MRKTIRAAIAGLALVGGAATVASTAQAQGYYYGPPVYNGQNGYYAPPPRGYNGYPSPSYSYPNSGYYNGYSGYNGGYGYNNGYNSGYGNNSSLAGIAGALLGSVLGNGYSSNVPYDQYGPDPNGMRAADGHKIKCKLRRNYDNYYRAYVTRRECR